MKLSNILEDHLNVARIIIFIFCSSLFFACTETDNLTSDGSSEQVPDLDAWLEENPTISQSIKLESANLGPAYVGNGSLVEVEYENWDQADKDLLLSAFQRAWYNIHQSRYSGNLGTDEFAMPMSCINCATAAAADPNGYIVHYVSESVGKNAFLSYVAQSLALEMSGLLGWSISELSESDLYFFLNSRSLLHRRGLGTADFTVGGHSGIDPDRTMGSGSPATPVFNYDFLMSNNILADTHEQTIHNMLEWFRDNAVHFYGPYEWQNAYDNWGSYGMTPANAVIEGTIVAPETTPRHWTAGCHGTNALLKSVLKSINIPVQLMYICGHSVTYFPSIDRYMDHGDNPYNGNVRAQPGKDIAGILLDPATFEARFGSDPHGTPGGDAMCSNIGQAAADF